MTVKLEAKHKHDTTVKPEAKHLLPWLKLAWTGNIQEYPKKNKESQINEFKNNKSKPDVVAHKHNPSTVRD